MDDDSRIGRPPRSEEASSARLVARVTAGELEDARAVAKVCGETLSEFVRRSVSAMVARERVRKNMGV